jgi:Tfp pilus assembly protein PilO
MEGAMKKILDAFNGFNERARYGVLAGVAVLVLSIDGFFLVLPQIGSITDIKTQIDQLAQDTEQVSDAEGQIGRLKKGLQQQRAQLEDLNARIRPLQEVPAILSVVSGIADQFGVKIDQLLPEKDRQTSIGSASEGRFYSLPIAVKARGGYHKFGRFLNKLENQEIFFTLDDFIVQNDGKDPNVQSFSMTIRLILKGDKN